MLEHPGSVAHAEKESSHYRTQIESDNSQEDALSHRRVSLNWIQRYPSPYIQ